MYVVTLSSILMLWHITYDTQLVESRSSLVKYDRVWPGLYAVVLVCIYLGLRHDVGGGALYGVRIYCASLSQPHGRLLECIAKEAGLALAVDPSGTEEQLRSLYSSMTIGGWKDHLGHGVYGGAVCLGVSLPSALPNRGRGCMASLLISPSTVIQVAGAVLPGSI